MKKCPFCAEEIQEEAIKCRYCNEILIELTLHKQKEEAKPSEKNGKLVPIQVLADILGVPKSWIYDKTRRGPEAIPHLRMGKYVRFNPQEVVEFFQAKEVR